jgi:hypothetical protein
MRWGICALLAVCSFAMPALTASSPQAKPQDKAIVEQARKSYYSLKAAAMAGFQCEMTPNWGALLEEQHKSDPAAIDTAIVKLKQIHFFVVVDADGAAKVSNNEIPADNETMAEGLKQVYSGMEQMTSGFFQTWAVFAVNPPLPDPATEFILTGSAPYKISYKDGDSDIVTVMGADFAVTSLTVTAPSFVSVLKPQFSKTSEGFLVSAYDAVYEGDGGKDLTVLHVSIDYQPVANMQLPAQLRLKGAYNSSPFQVEVAFTGCKATRR